MSEPINYQVIKGAGGEPEFAVVPYDDFMALMGDKARIPHAVAKRTILDGVSLLRAWREHKGFTQKELTKKAGITQAALSQMERPGAKPQRATVRKLASALGITEDQLVD